MRKKSLYRPLALVSLLFACSGCATLGGNVKGSFTCQAPAGNCAPTSVIDEGATRAALTRNLATLAEHQAAPRRGEEHLKVVLSAVRDAQGRLHEARIVTVRLPDPLAERFRDPPNRNEIARNLARAIAALRQRQDEALAVSDPEPTISALPDVLTAPSQHAPAGGPGPSLSPSRVPHPDHPVDAAIPRKVVKP